MNPSRAPPVEGQDCHISLSTPGTRRIVFAAAVPIVIGMGLAAHYRGFGDVSHIISDAAYTTLLYSLVTVIAPRQHPRNVAAVAVAASCAVELFQLTGIPRTLAETTPTIGLLLGAQFQAKNLATYLCTGILLLVLDWGVTETLRIRTIGRAER